MKVYIIYEVYYDETELLYVASSKEIAQNWCNCAGWKLQERDYYLTQLNRCGYIEEWEVDK